MLPNVASHTQLRFQINVCAGSVSRCVGASSAAQRFLGVVSWFALVALSL